MFCARLADPLAEPGYVCVCVCMCVCALVYECILREERREKVASLLIGCVWWHIHTQRACGSWVLELPPLHLIAELELGWVLLVPRGELGASHACSGCAGEREDNTRRGKKRKREGGREREMFGPHEVSVRERHVILTHKYPSSLWTMGPGASSAAPHRGIGIGMGAAGATRGTRASRACSGRARPHCSARSGGPSVGSLAAGRVGAVFRDRARAKGTLWKSTRCCEWTSRCVMSVHALFPVFEARRHDSCCNTHM